MTNVRKFSGFNSTGSDDVGTGDALVKKPKKESKIFSEGLHVVKIVSVKETGAVDGDNSWEKLWLKVEGTGEKSTYCGVMFPTASLAFKGEMNSYPAQLFISFVQALGYSTSSNSLPGVMAKLFGDTAKLEGLELQVQIGYKGNHLVYKDKQLHLVQKYGRPVLKDGEPAIFNERAEAEEWAASVNLPLQKFPEVVGFIPAENLKTATPVANVSTNKRAAF